jgi:hypothetical protein
MRWKVGGGSGRKKKIKEVDGGRGGGNEVEGELTGFE